MIKEREILKLVRFEDGRFGIYADRELIEIYEANLDSWHAMIPIKLWRAFNKIVESRVRLIKECATCRWNDDNCHMPYKPCSNYQRSKNGGISNAVR